MFKNLFKTALRNIRKEKIYSVINILGLTIGVTCCIFLLLYILDELSYDKFHVNKDRIYRIATHFQESDNEFTWASAQVPLAPELASKFTEVQHAVRLINVGRELFENQDKDIRFYEEDFYYADSAVFDVFTFPLTEGNPTTALVAPNTIVLTQSMANKYFGDESPIGKTLKNGDKLYKITGVMQDVPHNSHIDFDALLSRTSLPEDFQDNWGGWGVATYLLLPENYNYHDFDAHLEAVNTERVKPIFDQFGVKINYFLQPIQDIHLHSKLGSESEGGGDISYIYIFAAVAVFMLIIASINYMNLATARATKRAKEVGIRKTAGSSKGQLIGQFLTESVVITLIAVLVSVFFIVLLLPLFNTLSGKEISYAFIFQPGILLGLVAIVLFVGVAGGSYPAFYLAGFNPAQVLKGKVASTGGNSLLRKALVVLQFAISITMVISTWIVYDQLQFLRNKDLGFSKEHVLSIELPEDDIREKVAVLRNRLLENPKVQMVGTANTKPGNGISKNLMNVESDEGMVEKGVDMYQADYDYIPTMGMALTQGRNFSREYATDTAAVIVNEAMVKRMGWQDPIGKVFSNTDPESPQYRVVGVIKDYHQLSLYNLIEPLAIFFGKNNYYLHIKIAGQDIPATLSYIENIWNEVNPNKPFSYNFMDQDFNSQYKADEKRGQIFTLFSVLTIFIACLGLLGLAAYTTEQRTKEIGIRKVIGANVGSIVMMIYKDFFLLIGISILIAFPLAYYFMYNWLQSFAYQTDIKIITFITAALLTLAITMLAVGFHTIRAAIANPVDSLRSE